MIKSQLIILGLLLTVKFFVVLGIIPTEDFFLNTLNNWFLTYGLFAVLVTSFLENIIGIGAYFPGSIVILTAMALTAGNELRALATFFVIVISSALAHFVNYGLGRSMFGVFERFIKKENLQTGKNIHRFLGATLWHPHFAAASCLTLGAEKVSFWIFVKSFIPIHFAWNIFWGVLMYNVGKLGKSDFSFLNLFYLYLFLWMLWDIIVYSRKKNLAKL